MLKPSFMGVLVAPVITEIWYAPLYGPTNKQLGNGHHKEIIRKPWYDSINQPIRHITNFEIIIPTDFSAYKRPQYLIWPD